MYATKNEYGTPKLKSNHTFVLSDKLTNAQNVGQAESHSDSSTPNSNWLSPVPSWVLPDLNFEGVLTRKPLIWVLTLYSVMLYVLPLILFSFFQLS